MSTDWYNPKEFRRPHSGDEPFHPDIAGEPASRMQLALFWIATLAGLTLLSLAFANKPVKDSLHLTSGRSGHFHVDGNIRQQPVSFLIDTGATTVTLPESMRGTLGIRCERIVQSRTANGTTQGCVARLEFIDAGPYRLPGIDVHFLPNISGALLGMNAIGRFRMSQQAGFLSLTPLPGAEVIALSQPPFPQRDYLLGSALCLFIGGVVGFRILRPRSKPEKAVAPAAPSQPVKASNYEKLLWHVNGDVVKAERLIAEFPNAQQERAAELALKRMWSK